MHKYEFSDNKEGAEKMNDYEKVLKALSERSSRSKGLLSILDMELSLPNIPMPTAGGEVFWNTIVQCNGWKLQQNMITHHARILDDNNYRIAWGTINGMMKAMKRMALSLQDFDEPEKTSEEKVQLMDELQKAKALLEVGAITEDEYASIKKRILRQLL